MRLEAFKQLKSAFVGLSAGVCLELDRAVQVCVLFPDPRYSARIIFLVSERGHAQLSHDSFTPSKDVRCAARVVGAIESKRALCWGA